MNKREAIQEMLEGKKVRRTMWSDKKSYYCLSEDGIFQDQGIKGIDINYYDTDNWEIYTEPPKPKFKAEEYVYSKRLSRFVRISNIKTNKLTISYSVYDGILYYEALEDDLKGEED